MTTIAGLTEDAYKTAVDAAVDLIRAEHPDLDLRAGTAVRSLVVEPGAFLDAAQQETVNRFRTALSLQAMARETTVPRADAEAVLSNFGVTLGGGTKATGLVRVNLTGTASVTVREGAVFTAEDSTAFVVTQTTVAATDPADGEAAIRSSGDGYYYFTVPVEAQEVGVAGNLRQGNALTCSVIIGNFDSAEAFSDFSGGEDGETVASAVARIPAELAYRGLTNALSVRAQLAAHMADASLLKAVSCVGHRDRAQLRDKHNPLGIAVGGRMDVYARLFEAPGVVSFVAEGTLTDAETFAYRVPLPSYPGFYAVKFVGPADQPDRQGSLPYTLVRTAVGGAADAHDFKLTRYDAASGTTVTDGCEAAWSAYQDGYLTVYSNSDNLERLDLVSAADVATPPETASFKIDLFWTDGIRDLQTLVDGDDVRNVAADCVVRSPALCLVSLNAVVRLKPGVSVTAEALEAKLAAYVNGRSFVRRLTRSELANVLLQNGVASVDLSTGGMYLGGRVCGADGTWYYLEGDALDLDSITEERAMVTPGTTVFAAEPGALQITLST